MPGNMQQQQLMMMPGYPYMNPGMMANNPIMMSPMSMNPCTGMSPNTPMTMQAPHGLPTMMQPMQASPAGFSANAIPVDDMTDDEEPDTAGVPEQQQGQGETPSSSASGSEAAKAPRSTSVLKGLPRTRLVQSLEKLHGELEAGITFCNCVSVVSGSMFVPSS